MKFTIADRSNAIYNAVSEAIFRDIPIAYDWRGNKYYCAGYNYYSNNHNYGVLFWLDDDKKSIMIWCVGVQQSFLLSDPNFFDKVTSFVFGIVMDNVVFADDCDV